MKLTPYRRTMLIVLKTLEYAESGGMAPDDCGAIYQSINSCLVASAADGKVEEKMQSLLDEISVIFKSKTWNPNKC